MDVCALGIVIIVVVILIVILVVWALWKLLQPEQIGVGAPNPYVQKGPPPMPPGTFRSHITPQGVDAGVGVPPAPPCPRCGTAGTFDQAKGTFFCRNCRTNF